MARLAYCNVCKATYPLSVVQVVGGRSGKVREVACPMGHSEIEESSSPGMARDQR